LLLAGEKTMEVRSSRLRAGWYYLGTKGNIYGKAHFAKAVRISSSQQWHASRGEHRVSGDDLPYKKTWGLRVLHVRKAVKPKPYVHTRGAIGIVRYRPR
jgi:hypothetical protein